MFRSSITNTEEETQTQTQTNNSNSSSYEIIEIKSWDELPISEDILRGIYAHGFEKPSPIQSKAILPIMQKKDVIAQAQSGTGKTAAFTVGALSRIDTNKNTTQVLILSPTRELSKQTTDVIKKIGSTMNGLRVELHVGGTPTNSTLTPTPSDSSLRDMINAEDETPTKNPHIVTGCPGRVFDMIKRRKIIVKNISLFILDEADELLSSGFKDQIYNIFQYLKNDVQVALFSATLPFHLSNITSKFMRDPVNIQVKAEQLTLEGITQYFVAVENDTQKYETLKDLYSFMCVSQCIIYCNSIKRVSDLYHSMVADGFPVCCIHSSMDKVARDDAYTEFRNGKYRVLISSNVTARGIDIQQVSVVINFDLGNCIHTYLHRIGRSGRWGRKGVGINFITRHDITKIKEIEKFYSTEIKELPSDFTML